MWCFFFQAEDGIRDLVRSRGLGDVYKRQNIPMIEEVIAASRVTVLFLDDNQSVRSDEIGSVAVSYTHLTLPTIYSV